MTTCHKFKNLAINYKSSGASLIYGCMEAIDSNIVRANVVVGLISY